MTCSDLSLTDARTNNFSLINIIEELHSPTFPFIAPRLIITTLTERSKDEESLIEMHLEGKLGANVVIRTHINLDFLDRKRCRAITELQGLVIPTPGDLVFALQFEDSEQANWTIKVDQVGGPKADLFTAREGEPPIPAS